MSDPAILSEVSADRIRHHIENIVREIPHRAAGSANGKRMAEYSRDAMKENGLTDTVIHELPAVVSFPEHAEFRVEAPSEISIQANTLGHSLKTTDEGIRAEIIDVGGGAFSDYAGKDARGKIILTELSYSPARHEKQRIAGMKGAIGAVMMNWGQPENEAVPFGSVKPVWGNPTPENAKTEMPTIPCIGIARTAGLKLREMAKKGPVSVWFRTHVENGWHPVQITIARMPPASTSPEKDDFVLVGGHQDSWPGEAATDNAAGNACKMELARVFMQHRDKLRRGLTFGFWTAHETGTMAGSAWYADRNWDDLRSHCVAYLQIDQPAFIGTTEWATHSNAELKTFHSEIEDAASEQEDHVEAFGEVGRLELLRTRHSDVRRAGCFHRRRAEGDRQCDARLVAPFDREPARQDGLGADAGTYSYVCCISLGAHDRAGAAVPLYAGCRAGHRAA